MYSFLPDDESDRRNLSRQGEASHCWLHAFGEQALVEIVLLKQLTAHSARSLVPKTWRDRFVDSTGVVSQVLGEGMSSEKHLSLPERQKYFPASSPLAIVP